MVPATLTDLDAALRRLGSWRVKRAQEQGELIPGVIGGWVILALGMRETWGRNIEGGARYDEARRLWVPETDPLRMDVGWLQISRRYHLDALAAMPGVRVGTWAPMVDGHTAAEKGYVPTFTHALRFTVAEMERAIVYGSTHGVPEGQLRRFAVAAHNAGQGGAMRGFREGNVDKYTAGGDYSRWVMDARKKIGAWLNAHPSWQFTP